MYERNSPVPSRAVLGVPFVSRVCCFSQLAVPTKRYAQECKHFQTPLEYLAGFFMYDMQ